MAKNEDKKALKQKLEQEAAENFEAQNKLVLLEKQLEKNVEFKNYLQLKNKLATQDALFRESVKNEMIKYDIPTIKGDWGILTVYPVETYKVLDEKKVPTEYKQEKTVVVVDTKQIKEDFTLTGVLPAGVERTVSQRLRITPPKETK